MSSLAAMSTAGATAATILGGILAEHFASQPCELPSALLCWAVLSVAFKYTSRQPKHYTPLPSTSGDRTLDIESNDQPRSRWKDLILWLAAACLVGVSIYSAELGMVVLLPALTPLLLVVEHSSGLDKSNDSNGSRISDIANSYGGSVTVSILSIGSLVDWNIGNTAAAITWTVVIIIFFILLAPRFTSSHRGCRLSPFFSAIRPFLDIRDTANSLAWRTTLLLAVTNGVDIYLFGPLFLDIISTLALGLSKAVFWYFLAQTITNAQCCWRIATTVTTFSLVASLDPFVQRTNFVILTTITASFLSLVQTILLLPRDTRFRAALFLFALIPLIPFLLSLASAHGIYPPPARLDHHEHPVVGLMRQARAQYEDLVLRQSQNMTAATNEYRRRYSTDPPPGFDQWFSFAQEQESIIIDNYDMIHNSLAPLRALSGQDIRKQMQYVYSHPDGDVWRCTFVAKTNKTECTHPSRSFDRHIHNLFDLLLGGGDFGTGQQNLTIPPLNVDVTFLVNHLDEPRVLLPPHGADTSINIADLSHQPVWDILTRTCTTKPTTSENTTSVNTYGLPFVTDIHGTNDLCQNPEYRDMHGMLESPVSFPLIQGLVPVLSCGVLSTMGDVPYPSAAYRESGFLYDETHDVPWEQKSKTVYWAGSTTGGYAVDGWNDAWRTFQRQRLVDVASGHQPHTLLSDRHGQVHTEKHHPNGRLWDIAFTRVFQCDHRACRAQISRFRPRPWAPADAALGAQLVVGVDGNGISGRYTKLLASSSAPLKQTLLREWHDERLVPWVHYFPLSQSLDEMPELATFLLTTETGQWAARTVAEEGRVWSQQALRPADMAVYMYRLLLELAQLQDPKRPAGAASAPVL